MNNKIKNYFQTLYNQTGVKPFTFLNVFMFPVLPVVVLIIFSSMGNDRMAIALGILSLIGGIAFNVVKSIKNFPGHAGKLIALMFLATIAFTVKFFIWPLIKFSYYSGKAATQANLGNYEASKYYSGQHSGVKKSAWNWFSYDGTVHRDEPDYNAYDEMPAYALNEGSYSINQNSAARACGYANGYEAEVSGRKWNEQMQAWA